MLQAIAIDQGTTSTRALAVGADGTLSMVHSLRHGQTYPAPGHIEQDAREVLANVVACLEMAGPASAIGLSNQGESCLAWDAVTREPLSPIITWQDSRTASVTERLAAEGHGDRVRAKTGLPLDPYFSASKLAWLVSHCPPVADAHAKGRLRLGTTDAFFLDHLTGHFATDVSTASRTSLMDLYSGQWDPALCALFGVPIECLPAIRPTTAGFGTWRGIPVTAAIVDQQAALYGHGCRTEGDIKITFGTGAFCLVMAGSLHKALAAEGGLLPTVAWDLGDGIAFALDGGVYDAGSAIEWALSSGIATRHEDFNHFDQPAAIDRGLVFVPAFSGLACPVWDRRAAPVLMGMTPETTMADMRQALLEGIALLTVEIIELAAAQLPLSARISVDGGLTRSPAFCQFLADSAGRAIVVPGFDELTALGTAALAAKGLGRSLHLSLPEQERVFRPAPVDRAARLSRFRDAVSRSRSWR